MKLMLVATLAWVSLGLLVPRLGRREQVAVYAVAVVIALLYLVYPQRFME